MKIPRRTIGASEVVLGGSFAALGIAAVVSAIAVGLTTTGVEPRNWILTGAGGVGGAALVSGTFILWRGFRQSPPVRESIVGINPEDLKKMTGDAIAVAEGSKPLDNGRTKAAAIELMRAMAQRSEDLWNKELGAHRAWNRANWSLGGLGAFFAAASGGGVLSGLTGGWRYVLGFFTLFGAALGAVAATLQTVRRAQISSLKGKRYESFARETWHNLLTVMPGMDAKDAVAHLQARSRELAEIGELGLAPAEERARQKSK
jgi:hypothetical protein